MKISNTFKHLLAASAVAATVNSSALHANGEPAAVELLSGSASLGAPVLSPRNEVGQYDPTSDAYPVVIYPINISATITAETNPTSRTSRGVTTETSTFSSYRVTSNTLLSLLGGNSSSRLVFVTDAEGTAVDQNGNYGLFICTSSNLATGGIIIPVDPETGVIVNLAAGYPLSRTPVYSFYTSNNTAISYQTVSNIPVYFEADGYSAAGIGSFVSTLTNGLRFSANLTSSAIRLSGASATFSKLNDFTVDPDGDFVNTQSYSFNATNVTFNAGNFFTSNFSPNTASPVYSLASNGGLTGATINSTTGVITFNATTAGTFNPVVTATAYFNGRPTPTTVSTSDDGFATIALTVNPPVPVVTVTGNLTTIGITQNTTYSNAFSATNSPTAWFLDGLSSKQGLSISNGNLSANTTATNWSGTITANNTTGASLPVTVSIIVTPVANN